MCARLLSPEGRKTLSWVDEAGEPDHLLVQDFLLDEAERRIEFPFGTLELCLRVRTLTVVLWVR